MEKGLQPAGTTATYTVTSDHCAMRLDKYLAQQLSGYSRSFFEKLIEHGNVCINAQTVLKPSTRLNMQDCVTIAFPEKRAICPRVLQTYDFGVTIIHESDHFIVINKPAGLLVHPTSPDNKTPTLVDWLQHTYPDTAGIGDMHRPGIVHRLDKDTSGIMLIARTTYGHMILGDLFKNRLIEKTYVAIVEGNLQGHGLIDKSIGRDLAAGNRMKAYPPSAQSTKGIRAALTYYKVVHNTPEYSIVELSPKTGRTHQIRVHCASLGHPIVADTVYGTASTIMKRQALHAYSLRFTFDNNHYYFCAPIANDFPQLFSQLPYQTA